MNYGDVQDDEPTPDDEAMHGLIAGAVDSDDDEPRHTRKRHRKQDNVAYEDAEDTATHQGLCCWSTRSCRENCSEISRGLNHWNGTLLS